MSKLWDSRWRRVAPDLAGARTTVADALTHYAKPTDEFIEKGSGDYYERNRSKIAMIVEQTLGIQPQSALDVGCGTGHWSAWLHEHFDVPFERITALDLSEVPLDYVRQRCPGIDARLHDIAAEPIQGQFDLGVSIGVLHHVVEPERLATALKNMLAAWGAIIVYPVRGDDETIKKPPNAIKRHWRRREFLSALPPCKMIETKWPRFLVATR